MDQPDTPIIREFTPSVEFTPDTIPAPKQGLSLQAQAAYTTAVAIINGHSTTPHSTPIIGAVEVDVAKMALSNALGISMDNPHAVIMRYGDHGTSASATHVDAEDNISTEEPAQPKAVDIEDIEAEEEPEMSITGLLNTIANNPTIPLAIVGDAGTGKTSIIRKWAEENGYELNLFLANTASEDDVAGAITPDHDNKMAVAYPLEKLHRSTTHRTVLFLDELNTARREVQDPLLTLIQDRCLPNGTPLHPDTIIVTAINPSATYNNHEMSPQMRNRFMWYYHSPTEYDWLQWLQTTPLGNTPAGRHIEAMVLDGTLKFDKDDAFTEERNEFTTPRSLYNLLKVSGGSIRRMKAFADSLVSPAVAEAIRLHGYTDKDSRGNSFFEERKKEAPAEEKSEYEVLKEYLEKIGMAKKYNLSNGLDMAAVREMMKADGFEIFKQSISNIPAGHVSIASTPSSANSTGDAFDALGGTTTSSEQEDSLMADIKARMSQYGSI